MDPDDLIEVDGAYWCPIHETIHLGDEDSFAEGHFAKMSPLYRKRSDG